MVAVACLGTWPLAGRMATHVPGDLGDPLENAWIFGWGAHAFLEQPRAIFDANMFFPSPSSLAFAESMLGLSIPVAPVFWLTGNAVLAVNIATIAVLAISGWAMFRLVLELAGSPSAAAFAGTAYVLLPYRIAAVPHVHVLATHLLPLALLVAVRVARRDGFRWRAALGLAVVLGAQLWASLTAGMITLAAMGVACVWLVLVRRAEALAPVGAVVAGVAGGVLLAAPLLLTYSEARDANPEYGHPQIEVVQNSATLSAYAFPPAGGPVADDVYDDLADANRPVYTPQEKTLFPGVVLSAAAAIALLGAGLFALRREPAKGSGLALLLAAAGLVLSFGPKLGAAEDGIPLPFAIVEAIVPGGLTRVPARFGALVLLGLVVIVGVVIGRLPRKPRRAVALVIAIAIAVEAWPSSVATARAPELTDAHRALAGTNRRVVALPMLEYTVEGALVFPSVPREAIHLWYSTANFRPLVNGYGAFLPGPYVTTAKVMQTFPDEASIAHLHASSIDTVVVEMAMVPGTRWDGVSERLAAWPGAKLMDRAGSTEVWAIENAETAQP